jgi:phosphatidate cytidylyltransferase
MALNVPVFLQRTGSAIVFAAIMLTGLLWHEWAFIALFCMVSYLAMHEYFKLMEKIDPAAVWPKWLKSVMQLINLLLILLFSAKPNQMTDDLLWNVARVLPAVPVLLLLVTALSKKSSFAAWLQSLGGILYITVPVILLVQLRTQDMVLPMALIFMIWSNDTMAYLVGSFIGKHPLSPISPKKTWEGTIGGALLTLVAAMLYGYFSHTYRMMDWLALGLCATVAGSFGDLLESKLKRMAGVKDSGNIMPGHGGALDRFDSLLVAAPFAFVYVNYFMR